MEQWVGGPFPCPLKNLNCPGTGRVQSLETAVGDSGCRWRVESQALKPSLWKIKKRSESRELAWSDLFLCLSLPPSHGSPALRMHPSELPLRSSLLPRSKK